MKAMTTSAQILSFLILSLCVGCNSATQEQEQEQEQEQAKADLSPTDQYVAGFGELIDSITTAVETVEDAASETEAVSKLKELESKADELGAMHWQIRNDDPRASLQDVLKEKLGSKLKPIQDKIGKSEFSKLEQACIDLMRAAKGVRFR